MSLNGLSPCISPVLPRCRCRVFSRCRSPQAWVTTSWSVESEKSNRKSLTNVG